VEEVVADGKTGLLIPADESTPQKLAQMVGEVLLNRSTRFQGSVCRAHVREKFSMRAVGDQITEAIAQIEA
jgi:UDP:flavonoid glycosyltransferase YjiC (YdhE family)